MPRLVPVVLIAGALLQPEAHAASLHFRRFNGTRVASGITQRRRLHVDDLITEPGTFEIDAGYLYSWTTGSITMPTAIKWTPDGNSMLIGRTEYSLAFDSVNSAINTGSQRTTQFSDRLTFQPTTVVYDSEHFDIAVAPQITALLRNESGIRAGATVIARLDKSGNSLGATAGWTGATSPSDSNPAGVWDFGVGYGRKLRKFTPHANVVLERATGFAHTTSVFGGVEYQWTEKFAVDATAQRYSLTGSGPDRQILLGITWNFGRGTDARPNRTPHDN